MFEIQKQELSRVLSHGLRWCNKQTELKRSVTLKISQNMLSLPLISFSFKSHQSVKSVVRSRLITGNLRHRS